MFQIDGDAGLADVNALASDRFARQEQPSEGKGQTFESCRVRQIFLCLQCDTQTQPETPVLLR
jgi:hypothetical protein